MFLHFPSTFTRGTTFYQLLFASLKDETRSKCGLHVKEKKKTSRGGNCFLKKLIPIEKGSKNSLKVHSFTLSFCPLFVFYKK